MNKAVKLIHRIWCGPNAIPDREKQFYEDSKKYLDPSFTQILWTDKEIFKEISDKKKHKYFYDAYDDANYGLASDYFRLFATFKYGGWYLDMDMKFQKFIEGNVFDDYCDKLVLWADYQEIYYASGGFFYAGKPYLKPLYYMLSNLKVIQYHPDFGKLNDKNILCWYCVDQLLENMVRFYNAQGVMWKQVIDKDQAEEIGKDIIIFPFYHFLNASCHGLGHYGDDELRSFRYLCHVGSSYWIRWPNDKEAEDLKKIEKYQNGDWWEDVYLKLKEYVDEQFEKYTWQEIIKQTIE